MFHFWMGVGATLCFAMAASGLGYLVNALWRDEKKRWLDDYDYLRDKITIADNLARGCAERLDKIEETLK